MTAFVMCAAVAVWLAASTYLVTTIASAVWFRAKLQYQREFFKLMEERILHGEPVTAAPPGDPDGTAI